MSRPDLMESLGRLFVVLCCAYVGSIVGYLVGTFPMAMLIGLLPVGVEGPPTLFYLLCLCSGVFTGVIGGIGGGLAGARVRMSPFALRMLTFRLTVCLLVMTVIAVSVWLYKR